jgi:hypothetical protein
MNLVKDVTQPWPAGRDNSRSNFVARKRLLLFRRCGFLTSRLDESSRTPTLHRSAALADLPGWHFRRGHPLLLGPEPPRISVTQRWYPPPTCQNGVFGNHRSGSDCKSVLGIGANLVARGPRGFFLPAAIGDSYTPTMLSAFPPAARLLVELSPER